MKCGCLQAHRCSDCGGCYVHDHVLICYDWYTPEKWAWRCVKDGYVKRAFIDRGIPSKLKRDPPRRKVKSKKRRPTKTKRRQ